MEAVPSSLTSQLFSQGLKEPKHLQGQGPSPLVRSSTGHIPKPLHPARKGCLAPMCRGPTASDRIDPLKQKTEKKTWEEELPHALNSLFPQTSESKPLTGLVCSSGSPSGANFATCQKPCEPTVVSEASWAAAPT